MKGKKLTDEQVVKNTETVVQIWKALVDFTFMAIAVYIFWNWGLNHFLHERKMSYGEASALVLGMLYLVWFPIQRYCRKDNG